MANFSALPRDILGEIISHVTHGFKDLLSCSRVCKSISEAANAALYDHVNFSREYRYDATAEEKTSRRQARLLLSLSEYGFWIPSCPCSVNSNYIQKLKTRCLGTYIHEL
jgi:hypothetical protein